MPATDGSAGSAPAVPPASADASLKKVSVLFCDIVESTTIVERIGPEAMHTLLDRFFAAAVAEVRRYGGTVNKYLGDGFMALFGVPMTQEDHARRATLAALAIRSRIHEGLADAAALRVRMGINSGAVVIGHLGDELGADFTAVGDTINVAARLQSLAEPDEILVSGATEREDVPLAVELRTAVR